MAAPRNGLEFPDFLKRLADTADVMLRRLEASLHSDSCKRTGDSTKCCIAAKGGLLPTKALAEVVTAAKSLGGEIRQWDGHIRTNIDKLTPTQLARVMIQFTQGLPLSGRRDLYAVLSKLESERPDGLGLTYTDRFASPGSDE